MPVTATNFFGNTPIANSSPAYATKAITPSDTDELEYVSRLIYVGVGGDVVTTDTQGNSVTHKNVPSGQYIGPAMFKAVKATGTTATNMIAYV